jgi:hypothetical protein
MGGKGSEKKNERINFGICIVPGSIADIKEINKDYCQ